MILRYVLLFCLFFAWSSASAQQELMDEINIDSLQVQEDSLKQFIEDSLLQVAVNERVKNEMKLADSTLVFSEQIQLWLNKKRPIAFDIQQKREYESSANMFVVLFLMLLVLTYMKLAFANDLDELWLSVSNGNRAVQIYRTQTDTFTVSSFLLNANFVVSASLIIQFSMQQFSPSIAGHSKTTTFYLIILFTSFLLLRTLLLRSIGFVFSANNITSLFEFHFVRITQMLGLALLPSVLFMFALDNKFFNIIFIATCVVCCLALVLIVVRGLSTSVRVAMNSTKYFFIYVCVGEITLAFFFIKLLTKIVT